MRPRSLPFFDFSTSGQGTQGQLKVFSAQFTRRTRIACAFHAVCFGNYAFFQRLGRLPPAATKSVRSSSSFTVESLLRSVAVKLPAPGNKPNTGEDGCHFEACNASASSPCWPRCAPEGLFLLWGALEGMGRLSSLEGEAFPQAAGPDLSSGPWTQANVFSPKVFLGRPCALCACALWRQLERRFPQLSLY